MRACGAGLFLAMLSVVFTPPQAHAAGPDDTALDGPGTVTLPAPADAAARALLTEAVEEALEQLSDRERRVVRLRFGLDDAQ
mgnify:CR=1 FL=1